jgi:penicillin-binding protein 1A
VQKINKFLLHRSPWYRRAVKTLWVLTVGLIIGLPAYISAVISNPYNLFGPMPSLRDIENPKNDISSEVISSDGVSMGRYYRYNRSPVTFDDLSPHLVNTLLISEDHRFYQHSGMDVQAYIRVLFGLLTFQRKGGGSTLTQQTAKNLFRTREEELQGTIGAGAKIFDLVISKTKEWIIAYRLEQNFTKEEIITMYLNTVPFNNNAFGIKVAAHTYFNTTPSELNIQQSALLVGMLQGTSIYNPVSHPQRALTKRNDVLEKLRLHGYIDSKEKFDSIASIPLQLNLSIHDHSESPAPYFTTVIRSELLEWCKERGIDLYESGLKIHTTIDSRMQSYAEKAMKEHMSKLQSMFERDWATRNPWVDDEGQEVKDFISKRIKRTATYKRLAKQYGENSDSLRLSLLEKKKMKVFSWHGVKDTLMNSMDSLRYYHRFLHSGLLSMEPETGAVKAWVGGINHSFFKFDHVKQSTRQPGSTFKPFVYGLALENGFSPCHEFRDMSPTLHVNGKIYQARNSNGTFGDGQTYTLRRALAKSLNSITLQLMDKLRPENVAAFGKRLGITTRLDPVYSLGLGTSDVSLFDLVAAYSSFVSQGIHVSPFYISRIEDQHGNTIQVFAPRSKQVLDPTVAYSIVHLLKGGIEESGGTSQALSEYVKLENEIGGKTGTTDNGSDGWYVGVTSNLVTGVWVGGDERSIHFPRWGESSGGRTALPIWDKYMSYVYLHPELGYPKSHFKIPADYNINLDCEKYSSADTTFTVQ